MVLIIILCFILAISSVVKESIELIASDYHICSPKRILVRLRRWKRSSKNRDRVDVLPTLKQLQNYIYHQRVKFGDKNDVDAFKKYIRKYNFDLNKDIAEQEMFAFGVRIGVGSDEEIFNAGSPVERF